MTVLTFRDISKFSSVNTAIHLLGWIKIFKIKFVCRDRGQVDKYLFFGTP